MMTSDDSIEDGNWEGLDVSMGDSQYNLAVKYEIIAHEQLYLVLLPRILCLYMCVWGVGVDPVLHT